MKSSIIYLDGQYIAAQQDLLNIFMPGQSNLNGVFETIRTINGQPEYVDEHLERLMQGLKVLKIKHTYQELQLKRIIYQVVKRHSSIIMGRLRVMIFKSGKDVHCLVTTIQYKPPSGLKYKNGFKVMVIKTKISATAHRANVKSLNYSIFANAYAQAQAKGYDEVLLLNAKGFIFEASRSNVFMFKDNKLITPPLTSGCLNGIMRNQVIAIAHQLKVPVVQKNISLTDAQQGQVFLTNSLIGMMPVRKIL